MVERAEGSGPADSAEAERDRVQFNCTVRVTLSHKTSSWDSPLSKNGGILDPQMSPSLISQRPNGPLLISIRAAMTPKDL